MNDRGLASVKVSEHLIRIVEEAHDLALREPGAGLSQHRQRCPHDFFHNQIERAVFLEVVDVARQERVNETGQDPRLTLGQLDVLPRASAPDVERFNGDRPPFALIDGVPGRPLRALAKRCDQHVAPRAELPNAFVFR